MKIKLVLTVLSSVDSSYVLQLFFILHKRFCSCPIRVPIATHTILVHKVETRERKCDKRYAQLYFQVHIAFDWSTHTSLIQGIQHTHYLCALYIESYAHPLYCTNWLISQSSWPCGSPRPTNGLTTLLGHMRGPHETSRPVMLARWKENHAWAHGCAGEDTRLRTSHLTWVPD